MGTLICNNSGNLTGAATFVAVEVGASALQLVRGTNTTIAAAATVTSSTFTVTTGKVIDAILLWIKQSAVGSTGTLKVDLQKGGVSQASVTINKVDLPDQSNVTWGPTLFKLTGTATGDGAATWTVVITTTGTQTLTYNYLTSTTNLTRALRTTTAATPAAADDLYIVGELTGAGTNTPRTVTMDSTAITAYGNGALNSITVAGGGIHISNYGTLSYGTTASTNYVLRVNGDVMVYQFGTLNVGSTGAEIPRNSTAVLEFQQLSADGDFGLRCLDNAMVNIAGLSRTVAKNVVQCKLTSNVAAAGTTWNVNTDTGWLSTDQVCVASTTRTASECEMVALSGNASAGSFTSSAGAVSAHSGTTPTQAEVGLLTRNVKIRSTSTTLMSYVYCAALATVTVSWTEFVYLGATGATKRGIEVDGGAVTNPKSFTYCSLHDLDTNGFYCNASGVTSLNVTFSNNVVWNTLSAVCVNISGAITNTDWTFDSNLIMRAASFGFTLGDLGGVCTNNTVVGSATNYGFSLPGSTLEALGTFSNNTVHSNASGGLQLTTGGLSGTISNFTAWRNGNAGISYAANASDLVFTNLTLFGNSSTVGQGNFNIAAGDTITIKGGLIAGDTSFSVPVGFSLVPNSTCQFDLMSVDMSGTGGIYAPHTQFDFYNGGTSFINLQGTANNCKFGAPALFSSKSIWMKKSSIGFEKYNQTAGDHRTEMTFGQLRTDAAIYNLAAPSMRMTPNSASLKLESAPLSRGIQVAVNSSSTVTASVWLRKDAAYNGNQPRLIVRSNPAVGINSDTVLATYSAGTGTWNAISGTAIAATDDGAMEFIVDCDGTAGFINLDDWSFA